MNRAAIKYEFEAKPWLHNGPGGWHFVSLPVALSTEIRMFSKSAEEGWGRLKATAQIGETKWKTAIWFDKKLTTYLLPIKTEIRKSEHVEIGIPTKIAVWV